jgi:hypothetical protein
LVASCFLNSRSVQFEALANNLHGRADLGDKTLEDWQVQIVQVLRRKYVSLKQQGLWPIVSESKHEIQGLQAQFDEFKRASEERDSKSTAKGAKREPHC